MDGPESNSTSFQIKCHARFDIHICHLYRRSSHYAHHHSPSRPTSGSTRGNYIEETEKGRKVGSNPPSCEKIFVVRSNKLEPNKHAIPFFPKA
ncbi:hypothetical protein YC2023_067924 [Brassica napus]